MPPPKAILFVLLGVFGATFLVFWIRRLRQRTGVMPDVLRLAIGAVTDFLDTLSIGSFATTTSLFRFFKASDDRTLPGTLNVGHTIPTLAQAFIYILVIDVDMTTLVSMIAASVLGAWLGAGIVAGWPRHKVQLGMGLALIAAAVMFLLKALDFMPAGTPAIGLQGGLLIAGIVGNFVLGVLMTMGIGLYAPCIVLVSLLGMSEASAFPIMMGSCAFLMPVASLRFIREDSVDHRAALGLTLGGLPAVFVAAFLFEKLAKEYVPFVRWLVIVVVVYAAVNLLLAARRRETAATGPAPAGTAAPGPSAPPRP